jgi:hypothetical protein
MQYNIYYFKFSTLQAYFSVNSRTNNHVKCFYRAGEQTTVIILFYHKNLV